MDGISISFRSVDSLIPYARNSRTHSDDQVAQLAASIAEWGWTNPVLADERGIVAGHGRLLAARRLYDSGAAITLPSGEEIPAGTVPVIDCTGWSETKRRAYVIADNKLALNAGWDDDMLALEIEALAEEGYDLTNLGFDDEELAALAAAGGDGAGGDGEGGSQPGSLSGRFLIPPFSVLNAREGWWQERKRAWLALGIRSEIGRGDDVTWNVSDPDEYSKRPNASPGGSPRPAADYGKSKARGDGAGKAQMGGVLMKSWTSHPKFSPMKAAKEQELGRALTTEEFIRDHFTPPDGDAYTSGTSIFDPVLCELAYLWFSPQGGTVIDPFAGGSVRGVVASRLGRRYVGHELRGEQVAANRDQAGQICADDPFPPVWVEGDSRGIDRTCAEIKADMLFTCPPYADLEVYSDDDADLSTMDYPDFVAAYREIIAKACALLLPDSFAVCVVGEVRDRDGNYRDFVGDTVQAFRDAGLEYYNEAILVTAIGSLPIRVGKQFSVSRKLGKTHQNVLVFVKGDGKRAAARCGDVVIDETVLDGARDEADEGVEYVA